MILPYLKLMRLYYSIPLSLGFIVIVSFLNCGELDTIKTNLVFAVVSILSMISGAYVLNDAVDIKIDAINCPNRILPSGKLVKQNAVYFSIFLFALALALSLFCNYRFFIGICLISAGLIFYDLCSKRIGIAKVIAVAALTTSLYPLSLTITKAGTCPRVNVLLIHPFWLFLTSASFEMLKDIRDKKGDSIISGMKIFADSKVFLYISKILAVLASILTIIPFLLNYCQTVYLWASLVAIGLAVISVFCKPTKAINLLYLEIFIITTGSMLDLLVYGP